MDRKDSVIGKSVDNLNTGMFFQPTPPILVSVSIDIGSSLSGISWAATNNNDKKSNNNNNKEVVLLLDKILYDQSWNGENHGPKVPTMVLLSKADHSFVAFGYDAQRLVHEHEQDIDNKNNDKYLLFRNFKMQLYDHEKQKLDADVSDLQLFAEGCACVDKKCEHQVSAMHVFSCAIAYWMEKILLKLRSVNSENGLRPWNINWGISVPAIWGNGSKKFMHDAVKNAYNMLKEIKEMLSQHQFVPAIKSTLSLESENAMLFCQQFYANEFSAQSAFFQTGTQSMVVDLGGGTADMTVHETIGQNTYKEVCVSSGGNWGSNYIEEAFIGLFKSVCGEKLIRQFRGDYPSDWLTFMNNLQAIKHRVGASSGGGDNNNNNFIFLQLPSSLVRKMKQGGILPKKNSTTSIPLYVLSKETALTNDDKKVSPSKKTIPPCDPIVDDDDDNDTKTTKNITTSEADDDEVKRLVRSLTNLSDANGTGILRVSEPPEDAVEIIKEKEKEKQKENEKEKEISSSIKDMEKTEPPLVLPSGLLYMNERLKIPREVLLQCFQPVLQPILAHIRSILDTKVVLKKLKYLFSVGGLSESPLVREGIDQLIEDVYRRTGHKITHLSPINAGLAVLGGGVLFGLRPKAVQSRIMKQGYGINIHQPYNPNVHGGRKLTYEIQNGKSIAYCANVYMPICQIGDSIDVDETMTVTVQPTQEKQKELKFNLYTIFTRCNTPIATTTTTSSFHKCEIYTDTMEPMWQYLLDTPVPAHMSAEKSLQRNFSVTFKFGGTEIHVTAMDNLTKLPVNVSVLPGIARAPEPSLAGLGSSFYSSSTFNFNHRQPVPQMTAAGRFGSTIHPF